MHRRKFLGVFAAAGFGGVTLAACGRGGTAEATGRGLDRIGLQLYTVRDRMEQDVAETLRAVAEIGYAEVETAGLFGLAPGRFREELDRVGLVSPAAHVQIGELRNELDTTLATAEALGQRWVVVPWLAEGERTVAGYQRVARDLNQAGAAATERGIRVAYHNHEWEFDPVDDGRSGYDILLAETDPAVVDMELDLFWAVQAGQDPVALFERNPGRFRLCHVKDMADPEGERRMVAVGEGDIDFGRIFAESERAGRAHYFVEHDNPEDSLDSIRTSYRNLRALRY